MLRNPTAIQKYSVAAILVAVAFGLRYGLYDTLDHRLPFAFFIPATIIAAWYGGLGPGMLTALAGLLLGDYFFLPRGQIGEAERTVIGLYALNVALVVVLFWHLHTRLRDREDELKELKSGGRTGSGE
ncbi:MAG: DUF4118 domain-containing protein [Betaproteobacteria bacterium]|nr:DUF4118 domain-containing protein [Betaproteobacteria bacterium]